MELFGRLSSFPPADLLQWAKNERATGALVIRRSSREKRVYFRKGDVVACHSDDPAEFYGQYLLLAGHLKKRELLQALTHCSETGKRLGVALQDLGILEAATIQETLRELIHDAICDLFLWERGVFYFSNEMPPEEEILPLPLDTIGLVLEGTRWIDEYARIRRILPNDSVVLRKGMRFKLDGLSRLERRIATGVDGRRTLAQLYQGTRGSYFRFLDAALSLCVHDVVTLDQVPQEGRGSPTTREITIYDLLLEQATEEQVFVHRDRMNVPLDVLERLVPVWLGKPLAPGERKGELHRRADGTTRLGEILEADVSRESDLLFVELGRGNLALLPAPLEELERRADEASTPPDRRWWRRLR